MKTGDQQKTGWQMYIFFKSENSYGWKNISVKYRNLLLNEKDPWSVGRTRSLSADTNANLTVVTTNK